MFCSNCGKKIDPVIVVDIDGTLGDYHSHFTWFAEQYLGQPLGHNYRGDVEFSKYLEIPKDVYRDIKLAYRQGGMKRVMPLFTGASGFMRTLKAMGLEIWIATTRPYLRLDNIDPDTRHWLDRHFIPYDGMVYGDKDDKYKQVLSAVDRDRVIGVIDDLFDQCYMAKNGYAFLTIQKGTQYNEGNQFELRINNYSGIVNIINQSVTSWRQEHDN